MRMSKTEYKQFLEDHPELKEKYNNKKFNKKNKFNNVKVYVYNDMPSYIKLEDKEPEMVFDSIKEYHRYNELKTLEKAGFLRKLERQKKFVIQPAFEYQGEKIREIAYVADFFYVNENGNFVIEDVKAFDKKTGKYLTTSEFDLKWKLLKAKYPVYIFRIV